MDNVGKYIDRALEPIRRRALAMISRCVVQAVTEGDGIQFVQITALADETHDGAEHLQNYGFASKPRPGAHGVVIFPGGDRSHPIVVMLDDDRYRPKTLLDGESIQYNDLGDFIALLQGRVMSARANKFKFQGATDELMDLLVQVTDKAISIATALAGASITDPDTGGPQTLHLDNASAFTTLASDLSALKTKLTGLKA